MERRRTATALTLTVDGAIFLLAAPSRGTEPGRPRMTPPAGDLHGRRPDVAEITVYNVGLGLVKDRRKRNASTGESTLLFMDVASQVIPSASPCAP